MLDVLKDLFLYLMKSKVDYCVYKGLYHLEDDVTGDRGDIDIYVASESLKLFDAVATSVGFLRVERPSKKNVYYQGYDVKTGKGILLDVVSSFVFEKVGSPLIYTPSTKDFSTRVILLSGVEVNAFEEVDSIVIQLLTASFLTSTKKIIAFRDAFQSLSDAEFRSSQLRSLFLNDPCVGSYSSYLSRCDSKESLRFFLNDKYILSPCLSAERKLSKFSEIYLEFYRLVGRFLGRPQYKVSTGKIFAVVGVDGSGKSTIVEGLECNSFFKLIGISRIYFGANEFFIPGLLKIYNASLSSRFFLPIKIIAVFLIFIERHVRLLRAIYLKSQGNIIICDRYFYDDEVYRVNLGLEKNRSVTGWIKKLFLARVRLVPDKTFFLDVSPSIAYQRKQDFSYENMLKINLLYKNYMRDREEVQLVNADLPREDVRLIVHCEILNQLKSKPL